MKNLMKLGMALLIAVMVLGFVGCFEPEDDVVVNSLYAYNAYGMNAALNFRNQSNKNLVLFKGTPRTNQLLGGIGPGNWGVPKHASLLTKPEAFLAFIVTEEQYKKNMGNLQALDGSPFVKFYVFYNHQTGENDVHYDISNVIGGNDRYLEVITPVDSMYNVEFRLNGTAGPTLGYAQGGMETTKLYLNPDEDMSLYPVFLRYNPFKDILQTTFPKRKSDGKIIGLTIGLTKQNSPYPIDLTELLNEQTASFDVGAAYLWIVNNVKNGMISLFDGNGKAIRNPLGVSSFADSRVFEIKMMEGDNSGLGMIDNYIVPSSRPISNWEIGRNTDKAKIVALSDNTTTSFNLANGMMYTVNAEGDFFKATPVSKIDFANPTPLNFDDKTPLPQ